MKFKSLMLAALLTMPLMAHAENIIKVFAPINPSPGRWLAAEPTYGEWGSIGAQYGCSTWAPSVESALYGTTFTQTSSCSQDYQRTSQAREVNDITGAYRVVGNAATESKTSAVTKQQQATGVSECGFSMSAPVTYWYVYTYTIPYSKDIRLNGTTVWSGTERATTITAKGVTYRRGALMLSQNVSDYNNGYYQVCVSK